MLRVKNLCVDYGAKRVVNGLDLALGADEVLTLVGPTGCGKTTILQALAGLVPIAAGEVALGDWTATTTRAVPPEKRGIGMVFQDFALFPHLTVQENVSFRLRDSAPAEHWLQLMGLEAFRDVKPGSLSGGQKQRVALARALAHQPSLILLDEPLSNLDAALKDSLRWEIRNALKAAGVAAIWVTHDQDEALSMGDRLGVLREGALEQIDTPGRCFSEPANRFVAGFLGEASFIPGVLQDGIVSTELGPVPAIPIDASSGAVELLLRPDDLSVQHAADTSGNARITWARYEGGTWLYAVRLDQGVELRVRVFHENTIAEGDRVQVNATTTHPLAAFQCVSAELTPAVS
ncbi:MAG: ABC transporter ATP-binding protein [Congregibacter sp.]